MKTKEITLADVNIKALEANIERLDTVCEILKFQEVPETIQLIRLIQTSLMATRDSLKKETQLTT